MNYKEIIQIGNFIKIHNTKNHSFGIIDKNKYLVGNRFFEDVDIIYFSMAAVKDGNFWTVYNENGVKINQRHYKLIHSFPGGFIGVLESNNKWSVLNKNGEYLYDSLFHTLTWKYLDKKESSFKEGCILAVDQSEKHYHIGEKQIIEKLDKHLTEEFQVQDSSFVQGWNFMSLPSTKNTSDLSLSSNGHHELNQTFNTISKQREDVFFRLKYKNNHPSLNTLA